MNIRKDDYEKTAQAIKNNQFAAPEVVELFEDDEEFKKWYHKKYNIKDYYELNYDSKGRLRKEFFYEGNKWKEEVIVKKKKKKEVL